MTMTKNYYLYCSGQGEFGSENKVYVWATSAAHAGQYWASRPTGSKRVFHLARGAGIDGDTEGRTFDEARSSTIGPTARP